jgi:hypothetical protein
MNTNNLNSIIHELVTNNFPRNNLSSRYYNQPPTGGYQVNEEYEYVLPDNDDISSTVLLEIVTRFGSPEIDSFMNTIKREQIKNLKCKRVKSHEVNVDFVCAICIENFKTNEFYRQLTCKHCFHKKCIDRWFKREHNDCPMCRTKVI